jgi:hypothetical protein
MRSGRIIAEDAPDALLSRHGHGSLEATFLALCRNLDLSGAPLTAAAAADGERGMPVSLIADDFEPKSVPERMLCCYPRLMTMEWCAD